MPTNENLLITSEWLRHSVALLNKVGIGTARLDSLVLLEDATGKDRSWLLAHPEHRLKETEFKILRKQLTRRTYHEPLAYIRGKTEFYGREFKISKDTLEPRPETETIIAMLKLIVTSKLEDTRLDISDNHLVVIDVGTGSGCLAITAKLEFPEAQVIATDISEGCLKIARQNAKKLDAKINFFQGNILKTADSSNAILTLLAVESKQLVILANLPYVPDTHTINQAAMFEPKTAIFGGFDGLELYRRLFKQIINLNQKPLFILTESLPPQHHSLAEIAWAHNYQLEISQDFIQCFRCKN